MSESTLLVTRSKVTSNGTIYIDSKIREMLGLVIGDPVEVRGIEEYKGSKNSIIIIQKVAAAQVKAR